jgi:hypothetical protein
MHDLTKLNKKGVFRGLRYSTPFDSPLAGLARGRPCLWRGGWIWLVTLSVGSALYSGIIVNRHLERWL